MDYHLLSDAIASNVSNLFDGSAIHFPYHNFQHTQLVVKHASFLAKYYKLNEEDTFIVTAAAWFHDTGHLTGALAGHEAISSTMMKDYLGNKNLDEAVIRRIEGCIAATQMYAVPCNLPEMILCDADTWHLGTPAFRDTDKLVRQEMELRLKKHMTNWIAKTIGFLEHHQFFTGYCKKLLDVGKSENIQWLRSLPADT